MQSHSDTSGVGPFDAARAEPVLSPTEGCSPGGAKSKYAQDKLWHGSWRLPVGFGLCCLPWLVLLGWLTSVAWFLCDDAFISFRYVRNLLEGHGLVFNPGEYVEGYSNFLWVLELAALWGLFGLRPEDTAPWLSVACTAGTLAAMLWWVAHAPGLRHRKLVAWMALGLVCSSATFAVWTSGGGLETRQFTFFVVLAVVCLSLYRHRRNGLLAASLSLALAAYTRPEGPLIAACCFGWFALQRMVETGRLRPDWRLVRELAYLVAPFVVLVAAHFLFRYAYYGEWLPNTYYAKHIRPWYEAGFRYLWAATLETGLYLLLPLAFVALRARWKTQRDLAYALPLLCIIPHMAYIMRIGGDHFEYRPLDFYWPLLAVPAAVGIVWLGDRIRPCLQLSTVRGIPGVTLALFFAVVFYASVIQNSYLYTLAKIDRPLLNVVVNLSWLVPGVAPLGAITSDLYRGLVRQFVGIRASTHHRFADRRVRDWSPYEHMDRDAIPDDAVMAMAAIGIPPYYVPALTIVDIYGLTDTTVTRHPVEIENRHRMMAHDRRPPPGYLEQRGVNFTIHPPVGDGLRALTRAHYAARVGPKLWMPFDTPDPEWAVKHFAGYGLRTTHDYDGLQVLSDFEDGLDGWQPSNDGIGIYVQNEPPPVRFPTHGNAGFGFLSSFHPRRGYAATATARSPKFIADPGDCLTFLLAGGRSEQTGARLLVDDTEAQVWHSANTGIFEPIVYPLTEVVGKTLQLELFDDDVEFGGHIMLDHVTLVRGEATCTSGSGEQP